MPKAVAGHGRHSFGVGYFPQYAIDTANVHPFTPMITRDADKQGVAFDPPTLGWFEPLAALQATYLAARRY